MKHVQRIVGVICLAIGIVLIVQAHDMAQSLGSQVKQMWSGAPSDRSTYFYIGGIALALFGVYEIIWPIKTK